MSSRTFLGVRQSIRPKAGFEAGRRQSLFAVDQLIDLGRKIVLALFETLASLVGDEGNNLDFAAQRFGGVLDIFADLEVVVLDVLLLEQAGGVVELGDAALDHLRDDRLGLVGALGIVLDLGEQNLLFVVNHRLRHLRLADVGSAPSP